MKYPSFSRATLLLAALTTWLWYAVLVPLLTAVWS